MEAKGIWAWFFVLCQIPIVLAIKDNHSKRYNRKLVPDVHRNRFRTLQDWLELNHEVLVLQCNALNLSPTGSHVSLANRLFNHYDSRPVSSANNSISTTAGTTSSSHSSLSLPTSSVNFIDSEVTGAASIEYQLHQRQEQLSRLHDQQQPSRVPHHIPESEILPGRSQFSLTSVSRAPVMSVHHDINSSDIRNIIRDEIRSLISSERSINNDIFVNNLQQQTQEYQPPSWENGRFNHVNDTPSFRDNITQSRPLQINHQNVMQQNTEVPSSSSVHPVIDLPAVPGRILDCIRRGEFISFDAILSSSAAATIGDHSGGYTFKIKEGAEPTLSLVPTTSVHSRTKVRDFFGWVSAWSVFLQVASFYHPHLTRQLISYQSTIASFANQYSSSAWIAYDISFRHHRANNLHLRWDKIDDEIYNTFIRGAQPRLQCFSCRQFGHLATSCPNRSSSSSSSGSINTGERRGCYICHSPGHMASSCPSKINSSSSSSPFPYSWHNQPFRAPQLQPQVSSRQYVTPPQRTCHYFNSAGVCNYPQCAYAHKCQLCYGDHARSACPSTFKPNPQ